MTIVHVISTQEHIENYNVIIRDLYLIVFKAKYPDSKTRIQEDYLDKVTKNIGDCLIQLSICGRDHSDRLNLYIEHPDYPDTDQCLVPFDDTKVNDDLNLAYYYNSTARAANSADPSLTDNTEAEAKTQGFYPNEGI